MILIDTSGLLAALFADQREHIACAHELIRSDPPLILSPYVLAETDYLIQKFGGVEAELVFLEEIGRGAYKMPYFEEKDVARAREIIREIPEDRHRAGGCIPRRSRRAL